MSAASLGLLSTGVEKINAAASALAFFLPVAKGLEAGLPLLWA
jgi:hypothetical protein